MNLRREVMAGEIRDACAELLHAAGEGRAAGKLALTPASLLLRSEASARRRKSPLLQPAFESQVRGKLRELLKDVKDAPALRQFAGTPAAREIDRRIERERAKP